MVKKKGIVWNYFVKTVRGSQVIASCKFCNQSYVQNATRMERHIPRCARCPDVLKRNFFKLVRNKDANSVISRNILCNPTILPAKERNDTCAVNFERSEQWRCTSDLSNEMSNDVIDSDKDVDSKRWHEDLQTENVQLENTTSNKDWETVGNNSEVDPLAETVGNYNNVYFFMYQADYFTFCNCYLNVSEQTPTKIFSEEQIQQTTATESTDTRRINSRKRILQPPSSVRTSVLSMFHHRIHQEEYLEKRALRQTAELELKRKKLELEKLQWEFDQDRTEREARWIHECRMMKLKEQSQCQFVEQAKDKVVFEASHT